MKKKISLSINNDSLDEILKLIEYMEQLIEKNEIKKENLTFAEALQLLQQGKANKISCWNIPDIYVFLKPQIFITPDSSNKEKVNYTTSKYLFCKTLKNKIVIWIPNSYEMLEAKWSIVE